jgi:O-antigen/teichoic acid export membrane protein
MKLPKLNATFGIQMHQLLRFGALICCGILFTKGGLSFEFIANFEGLQYVAATLSSFWLNGLIQGALPYFSTLKNEEQKKFVTTFYLILFLLSIFIFITLYIFKNEINHGLAARELVHVELFAVYLLLSLPTQFLEYFYLLKEKSQALLWSSGLTFLLKVLSAFLMIFWKKNLDFLIYSWILIALIRHLFLLFEIKDYFDFSYDKTLISKFLSFAFPLVIYAFISQFAVNFDTWLVNYFYEGDVEKFSIFRYGARELPIFLALSSGLSSAMSIEIAKNGENGFELLKTKTLRLMHLCFPLSIVLLATSQYWFTAVFSKSFEASILIFDIFLLLIISRLLIPQSIFLAKKESKILFKITVIELFINIFASIFLIQHYGLAGVAFGTFIAFLSEKIILAFLLWKKYNIRFETYTPVFWWLLYSAILSLVFILKYQ